jgi:hypothetical protein
VMRRVVLELAGSEILVGVPESHRERMRGLVDPSTRDLDGLLLERARSVHTFGLGRPIRIVLLDRELAVLDVIDLPPRRLLLPRRRVRHVVELLRELPVSRGDRVRGYTVAAALGRDRDQRSRGGRAPIV